MIQKILFFFFIFVIAFFPGGIFISVFLLTLYYLVPLFLSQKSKNENNADEFVIHFRMWNNYNTDAEKADMKSYSSDTLEELK